MEGGGLKCGAGGGLSHAEVARCHIFTHPQIDIHCSYIMPASDVWDMGHADAVPSYCDGDCLHEAEDGGKVVDKDEEVDFAVPGVHAVVAEEGRGLSPQVQQNPGGGGG